MQNNQATAERTSLRLALIKQDVYQDLYACPKECRTPFLYSLMRSGPLGLFHAFDTTCFVVSHRESSATWKEKITDCPHHRTEEEWLSIPNKKVFYEGRWLEQKTFASKIDDLSLDEYDIVIAVDACIPASITKKTKRPLWCYYISECCMKSYKSSAIRPVDGYDIFLNQMFRPSDSSEYSSLASHVCEFPYTFQFPGIHKMLYGFADQSAPSPDDKLKISIPGYVFKDMSDMDREYLSTVAEISVPQGIIVEFLRTLNSTTAYARMGNRTKFGNETIEAVCAGNILISSTQGWKNRIFSPSRLDLGGGEYGQRQLNKLIQNISLIKNDANLYFEERKRQEEVFFELAYKRPLRDLIKKHHDRNMSSTFLMNGLASITEEAKEPLDHLSKSQGARAINQKKCLIFAFDAFDLEMARSTAIFYAQAGYHVTITKSISEADLIVWLRGNPPPGFKFSNYTSNIHFYPYVATPSTAQMECLKGTNTTIIHPSESLVFKLKQVYQGYNYIQAMPPVWLGEWSSRYCTPSLQSRIDRPVHIGHFKQYNMSKGDQVLNDFIAACGRLKAEVWGRGWESYLDKEISMGVMSQPISSAYSRYRVALGIMYSYQRYRTLSMRAWEAPLSGCVLLTEALPKAKDLRPPGVIEISYSNLTIDDINRISSEHDPRELSRQAMEYWQRQNSNLFESLNLEAQIDIDIAGYLSTSNTSYLFVK